ncbi:class 5 chitinase 1 [Paraphoma chrysanthemicola]|uniref:chitinase n=1 Tax=Paraphoma chrysanthemicola TaxID=798071 RepID=A0A8K0VV20_9PLEO|nr:class 5 chitinase 1 [Paraphoma chrysanthemicola]
MALLYSLFLFSILTSTLVTSLNLPFLFGLETRDLPTGTCNSNTPCENGACCGSNNLCGYTAKECGTGCQSNCKCNATAECGPYGAVGHQKCPLNVCCSKFGFCGSTPEFCVWNNTDDPEYGACSTDYGGCGSVPRPSCGGGSGVSKRNIGYYESWANTRSCQAVSPEDLNLDGFTSINFAFASFDASSFSITAMDSNAGSLYSRFTGLKSKKSGLQAFISIGGWSFTDPGPTQKAFSNMVSSQENRATFINNVINFMETYGFDGADLDWEYPGADDRGGIPADTANYAALCKEMSAAFGTRFQLTVTIPTSYWYLQHFDIAEMQESVSWFNLMAYDLHGTWDAQSKFVGPYIAPHTNITEIDLALDLLWRAGVSSDKIVMGQGWYGRSFTLADPSCNTPNGICKFPSGNGGAKPGPCSKASGILNYQEIADIIKVNSLTPIHDKTAGVKWITWDSNQWVSYDDADTFAQKLNFANSRCLGGMMVWAMDQVEQTASNGFGGAANAAGIRLTQDQQANANQATADLAATGTCYTEDCGVPCKAGTNAVAQHNGQPGQLSTNSRCEKKQYRSVCCDDKTQMGTCTWRGYRGAGLSCTSGCASGETEITTSTNQHTKKGDKDCHGGLQSYCCANFKPTTSSLKQDLADAAKAAAEAAAAQAALDATAKSFCRVAVPALLAPLEALEDLIPIIGEIADIAEIAATPAIIQGCVKGIEKEGKAEFKVFGKKHTVSLNEPAGKPTNVPDRPPVSSHPPAKTGDKGKPTCKPKAKQGSKIRAAPKPIPTVNHYDADTAEFKLLMKTSRIPDKKWDMSENGKGHALRLSVRPSTISTPHAIYIVGYVEIGFADTKLTDQCGETFRVVRGWSRDYRGESFDLNYIKHPDLNPDGACTLNSYAGSTTWLKDLEKKHPHYKYLGRVKPGLTTESIKAEAEELLGNMGKYNQITNNCYTFVKKIYAEEKA